jgi:uncharacterized protein
MNAMKTRRLEIALKAIPETGKKVDIDLAPEWFAQWRTHDPGLEFTNARITGTVFLTKHGRDILVRGQLNGYLDLACGRCLKSFTQPVDADFDLLLVPAAAAAAPEEEELSSADLDLDYYTGEVVDLETLLKEQIILMIPVKPLCDETCKGLCPQCGTNLNSEGCHCRPEAANSPFADLAKLKI